MHTGEETADSAASSRSQRRAMRSDMIKFGFERAPHRALLKATGVTDADMSKPFIAIANSYVDIVPGHVHLQAFGEVVRRAIREAGGVPFMFNTIGVDDGIAMGHAGMKYSLPSREIIADSVETMVAAHWFDGLICIPNCDKITPGMMMAAMRLNIPTIFVSGGPMRAGVTSAGKVVDLISVFEGVGAYQAGRINAAELKELEDVGCPTCGSCAGMFTANSMNCLCEALGLALPGNGTILAVDPRREELARQAARQLLNLIDLDLKPRDIVTAEAIDNAMALDVAMGGSTNTVLHVLALAHEADVDYPISRFNEVSARVPTLCKVSPSSHYHIEDVEHAGGVSAILYELSQKPGALHLDAKTVTGRTLGENIADHASQDRECIRTLQNPYSETGGLAILFGNLAPEGSVIKPPASRRSRCSTAGRPFASIRRRTQSAASWAARSSQGMWWSFATKAPRADRVCRRCWRLPAKSPAWDWAAASRSSPMAVLAAAPAVRAWVTSVRRRPPAAPSACCAMATW